MRKAILYLAVACTTLTVSIQMTRIWNALGHGESPGAAQQRLSLGLDPSVLAEPELLEIYSNYAEAQTRRDRAFFERVEAEELRLFFDGQSLSRTEDIELMNRSPGDEVYKTDDLNIKVLGDTAVVTGRMTVTHSGGQGDSWRWIDVCVKRGNRWQILSTTQTD